MKKYEQFSLREVLRVFRNMARARQEDHAARAWGWWQNRPSCTSFESGSCSLAWLSLCNLFLRQLEYNSQDIRKHRKAQGAGESSDLEIHAKIDWLNYVYGCPEELYRTIQYDTTDNRGYDFSTRKNVTAQLYPFKLENLQGEHSYGADRFILSTQSISPLLN